MQSSITRMKTGTLGQMVLYILAPTKGLVDAANKSGDYNDCSYVILYKTNNKKIVFRWRLGRKHVGTTFLQNHKDDVTDIDILLAPITEEKLEETLII